MNEGADVGGRLDYTISIHVRTGARRTADADNATHEKLNVAASAISRQVSDLEIRLALPLLERLPRGVAPTEAGRAIAEYARQQVEDGDRLLEYLRQLHGLRRGAIKIRCG